MGVLTGLMMLLMGLLLLWVFSAVFISGAAGLLVSGLLWLPVRLLRRRQLIRAQEQNPTMNWEEEASRHPSWFYLASALVIWLGCAAMLATLIQLPDTLYSPDQLVLVAGIVYLVSLATLLKCMGNMLSVRQPPKEAADTRALWSLLAGLLPMLSMIVWIFFVPNTAGWMVWREEARGYNSTQLRIPQKVNDAEHQQALLKLVQPLLEQGSRVLSHTARSRGSSSSYTLRAAVPARYRFHDGALELQLGSVMRSQQLAPHLLILNAVAQGEVTGGSLPIAWAQCQPTPQRIQRERFLGASRQVMQGVRACVQAHQVTLNAVLPLLQGNLQETQTQVGWFSPWRSPGKWQAVELPDEDELDRLDSL